MENKIFTCLICIILGVSIGIGLFYITDNHKPVIESKKSIENYINLGLEDNSTPKTQDISTSPTAVEINSLEVGAVINENMIDFNNLSPYFTIQPNFNQNASLDYIRVLHYGINNYIYVGELVVNKEISQDIIEIFTELFKNKYPIEKMKIADKYDNIQASAEDNNTLAYYNDITKSVSHSIGMAIDINPLYNPLTVELQDFNMVYPQQSVEFTDRNKDFDYKIDENDLCYKLFSQHGFIWGGNSEIKDYSHFEKTN